ncbi:MAG: hypothetical protein ACTTHG_06725 [Treponemataceae bacterium]
MKKNSFLLILICILFFAGCKTTDSIADKKEPNDFDFSSIIDDNALDQDNESQFDIREEILPASETVELQDSQVTDEADVIVNIDLNDYEDFLSSNLSDEDNEFNADSVQIVDFDDKQNNDNDEIVEDITENIAQNTDTLPDLSNNSDLQSLDSAFTETISYKTTEPSVFESENVSKQKDTHTEETQIFIQNADADFNSNFTSPEPVQDSDLEKNKIEPSRQVIANQGQSIIFNYPDNGWIYLGEVEITGIISFKEKKFSDGKTSFTVIPQKNGETILHFYKMDNLSQNYIDDYVRVIIAGVDSKKSVVYAPDYKYDFFINENSKLKDEQNVENKINIEKSSQDIEINKNLQVKKAVDVEVIEEEPDLIFSGEFESEVISDTDSSKIAEETSDELFANAKQAYIEKNYKKALELIQDFLQNAIKNLDEGFFLKGQILEEKSDVRNIREALNCYRQIVENYPQSDLWDSAKNKSQYIQRLYFNIR